MNKLSPEVHAIVDYITILVLFISPIAFQFQSFGSFFTYLLATVHLLITLSTNFPGGVFKIIPLKIHGLFELLVSFALVGISIWFKASGDTTASYFYLGFSVVLFAFWMVSDYKAATKKGPGEKSRQDRFFDADFF